MKRRVILFLAIAMLLACSACGSHNDPAQTEAPHVSAALPPEDAPPVSAPSAGSEGTTASVDMDLTTLSSTMVYAEVFYMMRSPEEYIGKTIRLAGRFQAYQDPETKQVYCSVIVEDAAACCARGFDLVMPEARLYPQDFPTAQSEVTVVGTLRADRALEEQGFLFLRLEDVTFETSDHAP